MDTEKAPKLHSLILAGRTKWCDLNLIRQIAYSGNGMWKKIIMQKTGGEQRREKGRGITFKLHLVRGNRHKRFRYTHGHQAVAVKGPDSGLQPVVRGVLAVLPGRHYLQKW